jgi:hemerythrin
VKELIWDKALSVEVDEIDDDHRRLVELFNILGRAVTDGDSANYLKAVLDELISCTVWHFKHEERLMLKYGYEEFEAHKSEHDELIETALELQGKILQQGSQVSDDDIQFLEHWLTGHILAADMKLGAFLVDAM